MDNFIINTKKNLQYHVFLTTSDDLTLLNVPVFTTVYLISVSGDPITSDLNTKYTFNASPPFDAKVSQYISLDLLIWAVYFDVMHVSTQRKLLCSVKVLKGLLV